MKSIFKSLAFVLLLAAAAGRGWADTTSWDGSDTLLYWMIDDSSNQVEFEYAVVYAAQTSKLEGRTWTAETGFGEDLGAVALPRDVEGGFGLAYDTKAGSRTGTLDILTSLGAQDYSAYSFYIELLQWDGESEIRKGVSTVSSYADLVANNHILRTGLAIPSNLAVWAPSTVPEPTSGLLLLIGCSVLLLKRRGVRG